MRCPACGTDESYTGLQWVHCKNEECKYYDARYAAKLQQEKADKKACNSSAYDAHLSGKVDKLILLRGKVDNSRSPKRRP